MHKFRNILYTLIILKVSQKSLSPVVATLLLCLVATSGWAQHKIVVASDRHGETSYMGASGPIYNSMSAMPEDVEYVCLNGDLVPTSGGGSSAPSYYSSIILREVNDIFPSLTNRNVSIVYGSHDAGCNDDAEIMKCQSSSGLIYTGLEDDGSVAYYIYGVSYDSMTDASSGQSDAADFMDWAETVDDKSIPVIVIGHVPLHYARKDNFGAQYWSKALNYAATGKETVESGSEIIRNVIYLHGHNHTTEGGTTEYYIPVGSVMTVQAGSGSTSSSFVGGKSGNSSLGSSSTEDHYIYYTYTTAGYLRDHKAATLITIDSNNLTITKYINNYLTYSNAYASKGSKSDFSSQYVTSSPNKITRVIPKVTLAFKNAEDNSQAIETYKGRKADVTLSDRTILKTGKWNTLCLPFDVDLTDENSPLYGSVVKTFSSSSYNEGTLTLSFNTESGTIPAGEPFIVRWETVSENVKEPVFKDVTISSTCNTPVDVSSDIITFKGTFDPVQLYAGDTHILYMGSNSKLYYPSKDMFVNSFRAYFELADGYAIDANSTVTSYKGIKQFVVETDNDNATSLDFIMLEEEYSDRWYTLDGRLLDNMPRQKGLYINNGNKVFIR